MGKEFSRKLEHQYLQEKSVLALAGCRMGKATVHEGFSRQREHPYFQQLKLHTLIPETTSTPFRNRFNNGSVITEFGFEDPYFL
jgi:hypothetical protein